MYRVNLSVSDGNVVIPVREIQRLADQAFKDYKKVFGSHNIETVTRAATRSEIWEGILRRIQKELKNKNVQK